MTFIWKKIKNKQISKRSAIMHFSNNCAEERMGKCLTWCYSLTMVENKQLGKQVHGLRRAQFFIPIIDKSWEFDLILAFKHTFDNGYNECVRYSYHSFWHNWESLVYRKPGLFSKVGHYCLSLKTYGPFRRWGRLEYIQRTIYQARSRRASSP